MDLQKLVDTVFAPTCVVSVEKKEDGGYGDIRLVAANKKYADMIGMRSKHDASGNPTGEFCTFVPGSLYTDYFPQNTSFEDVCSRSAVEKKEIHTYAHVYNVDVWFDIYAMPLELEDGNTFYCLYSSIPNTNADAFVDTFNTSQTANDVLKTCIKLHKGDDFQKTMQNYE